jgi:putative ABC transport system permease protein
MNDLARDIRLAIRGLRRTPGFSAAAVLTLAFGMVAAIAVFTILDAVLLRPLPYREADRLADVAIVNRATGADGAVSLPTFEDWRAEARTFETMAAWFAVSLQGLILTPDDGDSEELLTGYVTPGFFELLGVPMVAGRPFGDDAVRGADRVVVLSEALWRERFWADPGVIGRPVRLSGEPYTVVGVAPADLRIPSGATRIWVPLTVVDTNRAPYQLRGASFFRVAGRLAHGASLAGAEAELGTILRRVATVDPVATEQGDAIRATPFRDVLVGDARRTLWLAFGAVAVVVLLTCANVAGLLVARGVRRRPEFALRRALGAGAATVAGGVLVEGALLVVAAAGLGLLGTDYAVNALVGLADAYVPNVAAIRVDARVVAFAVGLAAVVTLLCAAIPAWWAGRAGLRSALAGRTGGEERSQRNLLDLVVAAQVAAAVLLAVGAGLFVESLRRLQDVPLGYQPRGVAVAEFVVPSAFYRTRAEYLGAHARILDEVRRLPGVEAVATVQSTPGTGLLETTTAHPPGADGRERDVSAAWRTVTPGYFHAAGIRQLAGRDFTDADQAGAPPVAIIDQALARRLFDRDDVVGRRFEVNGTTVEVVGVVDDVRHAGPSEPASPTVYRPLTQLPRRRFALLARTAGDPAALLPGLRAAIRAADPGQPIGRLATHEAVLGATISQPRFLFTVVGLFGGAALLLASLGVFGLVAYRTSLQRREMGIRMALGARPGRIVSVVLRQGLRLVGWGTAAGIAAAVLLGGFVADTLYGVSPYHPRTYVAAIGCALLAGLAACAVPAARAARVAPAEVLRDE